MINTEKTVSHFRTLKTINEYIQESNNQNQSNTTEHPFSTYLNTLKKEIVEEFKHWIIIKNKFPYDAVAETNHMIIPKERIIFDWGLITQEVMQEFRHLRDNGYFRSNYGGIFESLPSSQSQPGWFHVHLLNGIKDENVKKEEDAKFKKFTHWSIEEDIGKYNSIATSAYKVLLHGKPLIDWNKVTLYEKREFQELREGYFNKNFDNIIEKFTELPASSKIYIIKEKRSKLSSLFQN